MMNKNEVWKDIVSYEGYYQVSNLGRIKSVDRVIDNGKGGLKSIKGRVLYRAINPQGYLKVQLCKRGIEKTFNVHILVCMAFLNHKPNKFSVVVDHIDNVKTNNELINLQLISNRENSSKDKKGFTSKYVGVHWCKIESKWISKIRVKGKKIHIGNFNSEEEAYLAYEKKLKSITDD